MNVQPGTVTAIYRDQQDNPLLQDLVLQIYDIEKVNCAGETIRYKCKASDSSLFIKTIFVTKLNNLFEKSVIKNNYVIRADKFICKQRDNEQILIIHNIQKWQENDKLIGNPIFYMENRNERDDLKRRSIDNRNSDKKSDFSRQNSLGKIEENKIKGNSLSEKNNENNKLINSVKEDYNKKENSVKKEEYIKKENSFNCKKENYNEEIKDLVSIKDLTPFQNKWSIKGRCISKSDIKLFTNQKGEGKLFSVNLADETGSIKITGFSECVDLFYNHFDIGKVYSISKGMVRLGNKKFNSGSIDYELSLDKNSEVKAIYDENAPKFFFKFTKISDLNLSMNNVDIIGAVKNVSEIQNLILKNTGKEQKKKDLLIIDETGNIRITLWGSNAEKEICEGDVVAMSNCVVKEYNGITLGTISNTTIHVNPDLEESFYIKGWYEQTGKDLRVVEKIKENVKLLSEIKENEKKWGTFIGTILFIKDDAIYYDACSECNKKVISEDGGFRCEKCNRNYDTCNQRYMVQLQIGDFTDRCYTTCFDEQGQIFFGITAEQMKELRENASQMMHIVKGMLFKEFLFKVSLKTEEYQNEQKLKINLRNLEEVDYAKEGKRMLKSIVGSY
ncbi:60S acidic ribosomal protein P1 [Gurleya vavrai]